MAKNQAPIARFPLPDNWEVVPTVCCIIRIPDDSQYLSMLIGLLDTLKWSENYARDPTKTGAATVSRTWQTALESAPIDIKKCEDIYMVDLRRVKPGFPWISQQSVDDGETWHDYLIQPNWYGYSGSVWPDTTTDEDAYSVAGGITDGGPIHFAESVIAQDGDGFSRDIIANNLYAEFARFNPLPTLLPLIRPMVDAILDAPTPTVYSDPCEYTDFFDSLKDFLKGHPNDFGQLLSNYFFNWAQTAGDAVMAEFAEFYSSFAGNDAFYNYLADRESLRKPTFADICTYEHVFDFTTGMHGWVPFEDSGIVYATYVAGVGWAHGDCTDEISIKRDAPGGNHTTGAEMIADTYGGGDANFAYIYHDTTIYVGLLLDFSQNWTELEVGYIRVSVDENSGCSGTVYAGHITTAKIRGNGLDPYA